MAWEEIKRSRFGNSARRGNEWYSVPCVSVTASGIGFNRHFLDAFGVKEGGLLLVFIDKEKRLLGLRQATTDEDQTFSYRITRSSKKQQKVVKVPKTFYMNCKRIPAAFADCTGYAYRAHLNPGERMIVCEMSPDNRSK